MARLCIRIAPNDHPTDPSKTPLRTREGDVVEIREDGHVWRPSELNSGQYRFVDVPGVLEADLASLKAHVVNAAGIMIRRRNVRLNPAALNAGAWRTRTSATRTQITAITVTWT